ncbi:TetR family transcriptional regulator [Streptomyces sp. NPDC048290]|uniref:TetR family transcriptional regulator n=1 Tax=Streptomyces sp. NPDC048290 TaxID=3155811 RepID=UPI00341B98DD
MSHTLGARQAQKQRTRQALLDAALELLAEQSLSSLGLREVTRAAGVAPTAFYRHFRSTADLGVALVDEALDSLRPLVRATVANAGSSEERIVGAMELITCYVQEHPAHVRFLAREQHGGVRPVRMAIQAQLAGFTEEVKDELALDPLSEGWSEADLRMLAGLYVDHMLLTAARLLEVLESAPAERDHLIHTATDQLRLISLGRARWRP